MKKTVQFTLLILCLILPFISNSQVIPDSSNGTYTFNTANISFSVDRKVGARISSLKLNNSEIMYVSKTTDNWGSTMWSSPQSTWNWPPPKELNNNAYSASLNNADLIMQSSISNTLKYSFKKTFSVNNVDTSITIKYSIKNTGTTNSKAGAWEITRVPSGGLIFFPKGTTVMTGALTTLMKESDNVIWFDYDSTKIPTGTPKLFSDGTEGWIAYVSNKRELFIKSFLDTPASLKATGEAEIELYTNPDKTYTEIEEQGPYSTITPNETTNWSVKWLIRKLPDHIPSKLGDTLLLKYVRKVIANSSLTNIFGVETMDKNISLFPNPSTSNTSLYFNDYLNEKVAISIFDITGKEYFSSKDEVISSNNFSINLETEKLNNGMYLIKIQSNKISKVLSYIKE